MIKEVNLFSEGFTTKHISATKKLIAEEELRKPHVNRTIDD